MSRLHTLLKSQKPPLSSDVFNDYDSPHDADYDPLADMDVDVDPVDYYSAAKRKLLATPDEVRTLFDITVAQPFAA